MNVADAQIHDLSEALGRLDGLVAHAIAAADANELTPPADPFRGLHIGADDVRRWLARPAGASFGAVADAGSEVDLAGDASRFAWLAQTFGLSRFDLNLLVIALAPDVDSRYEGLYAYLQDDVTRRRPSVELALSLLCPTLPDRLAGRTHLAADSPLVGQRLLHLVPAGGHASDGLLSQAMRIDAQIVDVLLGQGGLDARLSAFCRVQWPAVDAGFEPCLSATVWEQLQVSVHAALTTSRTRQFYFCGPRGSGRRRTGEALAARAGRPLLHVDLAHARRDGEMQEGLRLACREAWLMGAVLFVEEPAARDGDAAQWQHELAQALDAHRGVAIVASATPWVPDPALPLGMTGVRFVLPDAAARCRCWQRELAQRGVSPEPHVLATLGARYRLWPGQVRDAVLGLELPAAEAASAPAQAAHVPPLDRLLAAARAQGGDRLAAYARHIEPVATRDDIVLPADAVAQLEELCARVLQGPRVLHDWGFGAKLSQGKGTSALFAGPSGTGKTMAAEVVANALALDLYKIDLAGVVSKYIGETEKNLDRIFDAAADANAILFFDEADALFGKRSEVRDSHDRYANLEISYLLQRMEQYEGVTILATNLRQNLDEAFVRRLAFCVHFPFPDEADRAHIWRRVWPASLPMADDVDFDRLARQFKLAGGNIRNIVMAAAFLAAGEGTAVAMSHLLHAARREYQKMGKELTAAELSQASVVLLERRA